MIFHDLNFCSKGKTINEIGHEDEILVEEGVNWQGSVAEITRVSEEEGKRGQKEGGADEDVRVDGEEADQFFPSE